MATTRKACSTKCNSGASPRTETRVLYLALELGWSEWKLAFATAGAGWHTQ
jgi:hypothetical protein